MPPAPPALPPTPARAGISLPRAAFFTCLVVCLGFAYFTQHAWEDYLITFRASLNLATGQGLVYQAGERVHTYTSPLGTLLPALFALGGGPGVEVRALWWFRVASATLLGCTAVLTLRQFAGHHVTKWAALVASALWIFDAKVVDFSINGMEVALVVFFAVLTWRAVLDGGRILPAALGFAGLQWTRPDGFIYFGALALAAVAVGTGTCTRAKRCAYLARGVALGLVFYLPWLLIAWVYYGTPVPHTIIAKQLPHQLLDTITLLALYPVRLIAGKVAIHDIFMPAYFYFGGWPAGLAWFARVLGTGAALAWVWPAVKAPGRVASAAVFLGGFYLEYIPGSPWYFPGWQVLAGVSWAYLLDALGDVAQRQGGPRSPGFASLRVLSLSLVAVQVLLLGAVGGQIRTQQRLIENQHRKQLGLWLKANSKPGDTVYLEPLGYIGFYSGLKMLDFPGLSSPEVVAARRAGASNHGEIIAALHPSWLVLRPDQVQAIMASATKVLTEDYVLVRTFDIRSELDAIAFLPGRGYLDFDARFLVYRRRADQLPHP